jgi:hypothetical protein
MLPIDLVKLVIMLRGAALSIAGLMGAVFLAVGWWSGRRCGQRPIACRVSKSALSLPKTDACSALSAREVTTLLEAITIDIQVKMDIFE